MLQYTLFNEVTMLLTIHLDGQGVTIYITERNNNTGTGLIIYIIERKNHTINNTLQGGGVTLYIKIRCKLRTIDIETSTI